MKSASLRFCLLSLTLLTQLAAAQIATESPAWLPREYRYDKPMFETSNYDPQIPTPDKLLGYRLGDRPATHAEVQRCFKAWDDASPRMTLTDFGNSHERRVQFYATITSGKNHAQLADIRASIAKLADPRKLKVQAEADRIIRDTPSIAWLAYCIHGDELSGTDAALAVVYHLLASRDREVEDLLEKTVICVDPIQNPDGRDRFIRRIDELDGYTPVLDRAAVQHTGNWPYGRTNHYLFDLNRDWIYSVHPETRNRQRMIAAWTPQLFVDSHEMGPEDSFLFNPAREPFNPGLSPMIRKWWNTFADDAGVAFDQHGWSYYSREWADFWYPGYSDGWACMHGSIGILYEQARTGGRPIALPTGRILTYREAVHHQVVCTMANLNSLLRNRVAVLTDFAAARKAAVSADESQPQTFLLSPTGNKTRVDAFVEYLTNQGVEVQVATQAFEATDLVNTLRERVDTRQLPVGTIIVHRRQPLAPLVGATLDFDPRMDKEFLDSERRELETKRTSRLYDITGWSPPMTWGLDAYWSKTAVTVATKPYEKPTSQPATGDTLLAKPYAYVIDVGDDSWRRCLTHMLNAGVQVRVAEREFRAGGRTFKPGSVLVRRHENDENLWPRVLDAAKASGA
ncbi:MAG: M14 family zinc carboxypeptidase, partial [Planctomycetota bacterium]